MPLLQLSDRGLFRADSLSWVMAGLIVFVIVNVLAYSGRYLAGDRNQGRHRLAVLLLGVSTLVLVFADHLLLVLAAWAAGNGLLVWLMIHKGQWTAARKAGLLALRTFSLGLLVLAAGFWLLADGVGSPSIHTLQSSPAVPSFRASLGLLLIAVAALTQSAAWPFQRWLMSSLNSPTPVSALMHAGLVNGGGFLLVRFAPLYLAQPWLLHFLFLAGLVTAVVGTFWKLVQPDLKRMLACSTMSQMGFMLMQCGMGLFGLAVSHLCWHGLFKAYLFLSAGSAVQEQRRAGSTRRHGLPRVLLAGVAGLSGAWAFATTSGMDFSLKNTGSVMTGLAFLAAAQLTLGLLEGPLQPGKLVFSLLAGLGAGGMYGASVLLVEKLLEPQQLTQAQPLDPLYGAGFGVLLLAWVVLNTNLAAWLQSRTGWKRLYMAALNASQPHPQTITATRTAYQH